MPVFTKFIFPGRELFALSNNIIVMFVLHITLESSQFQKSFV